MDQGGAGRWLGADLFAVVNRVGRADLADLGVLSGEASGRGAFWATTWGFMQTTRSKHGVGDFSLMSWEFGKLLISAAP